MADNSTNRENRVWKQVVLKKLNGRRYLSNTGPHPNPFKAFYLSFTRVIAELANCGEQPLTGDLFINK